MTAITSSPLLGRQEGSRKSWNRRNHRAGSDGDFGEGGIAGHAMGPKSNDVGHMNKQQFFRGSNNAKNWDGSEGTQERPTLEAKLAFGSVMKITGAQATREPRLGQGQSLPSSTCGKHDGRQAGTYDYMQVHKDTSFDINVNNFDVFIRLVQLVRLHVLDCMNNLQPGQHPPEDRVFLVQPWCRGSRDEELRPVSTRACVGHTDGIRSVHGR